MDPGSLGLTDESIFHFQRTYILLFIHILVLIVVSLVEVKFPSSCSIAFPKEDFRHYS